MTDLESYPTVPDRVIERHLRITLERNAPGYMPGDAAGLQVPATERVLGSYSNRGVAAGTDVVFTTRAIYQRREGEVERIGYEAIRTMEAPEEEKGEMVSATVVLRDGSKREIWIDGGGDGPRHVLQLHRFLVNILAARARGASF